VFVEGVGAPTADRLSTGRATRLVVVSTYAPRRCGIASYTGDLVGAVADVASDWRVAVCAVDRDGLPYGPPVAQVVRQDEAHDYRRAAHDIADRGTDLVLIEHEYGIFGGPDGAHVLALAAGLRERRVPYVVTLHTVLGNARAGQARVLRKLCAGAARVTVFTETARRLLSEGRIADPAAVVVVPHGAPEVLRGPVRHHRLRPVVADVLSEADDGPVLATFGLISPAKGLDVALEALPRVVDRHPGTRYLIAGSTHPEEARREGEQYREKLVALARRLRLERHVRFLDAFLTDDELAALLARTDLYLTPYRSPEQICSGALTFAVAAGCPVVSSDYRYAVDLLSGSSGGHAPGTLVPCGDPVALARAIRRLLDDPAALARAGRAARLVGAALTWRAVAAQLIDALSPAVRPVHDVVGPRSPRWDHLDRLTTQAGIVQFARGGAPDPASGYCVDDVARLGIVAAGMLARPGPPAERALTWVDTTLRFLSDAACPAGLHNLRAVSGGWLDEPHLGDHVGRAVWALGAMVAGRAPAAVRSTTGALLRRMTPLTHDLVFLRSVGYAVLGLAQLPHPDARARAALRAGAARLQTAAATGTPQWRWYEPRLTYDNARLPQALLAAGAALADPGMIHRGLETLDWYLEQVGLAGPEPRLRCVGNLWRERGEGIRYEGDEQPLDAAATVEALVTAWQVTGRRRYARLARRAFAWFHGVNRAGVPLYDPTTGGCRDGLHRNGVNQNMGAESTLAYHQALLALVNAGLVPAPGRRGGRGSAPYEIAVPPQTQPARRPALVGAPGVGGAERRSRRR
jgi:glycosyltransferase involved in cell wall biosynthesis